MLQRQLGFSIGVLPAARDPEAFYPAPPVVRRCTWQRAAPTRTLAGAASGFQYWPSCRSVGSLLGLRNKNLMEFRGPQKKIQGSLATASMHAYWLWLVTPGFLGARKSHEIFLLKTLSFNAPACDMRNLISFIRPLKNALKVDLDSAIERAVSDR